MKFDRQIIISTGTNRKDLNWKRQTLKVSELYQRLKTPNRGVETIDEYTRMSKTQQDELKDVGGFVAGSLNGARRKTNNVLSRDVITLDFDNIPAMGTEPIKQTLMSMGINFCIYSTRKHTPMAPRLRVLIPTDRTMTADEYEPCARRVATYIGLGMADPTTFEVGRLMYWPSTCSDSEYVYVVNDAPFMSTDGLLGTYEDWHDYTSWPQIANKGVNYARLAVKQGEPTEKPGLVGAFCRHYDIFRAIDELLPGLYAPCDNDPNRFTFTGGSTTGGAVVYDDGKFLYSHHATDPCSQQLVNAFDLVRLHKFADKDENVPDGTANNRLPSYKAMTEFANGIDEVAVDFMKQKRATAAEDFKDVVNQNTEQETTDENWLLKLERTEKGISNTINNVLLILENDPEIRDKFALNEFTGRGEVIAKLPWAQRDSDIHRAWRDSDNNNLYWWMETHYNIKRRPNIDSALDIHACRHAFNLVQDYLKGLKWDGVPRLDTLFIDYLGAEDNEYTRLVTHKTLVAAVYRAMKPGTKFDNMLILCGKQGIGKSYILKKLLSGIGVEELLDEGMQTFEGKEASEHLQGVWLVEVAELDAFRKSDINTIKQFLSLKIDRYRAAYGRNVEDHKRTCVFFGTCNSYDFLKDDTGNRRFWPVDVERERATHDVNEITPEIADQIWAEAYLRYMLGETLELTSEQKNLANTQQEEHREVSVQEGQIVDFIDRKIPAGWDTMDRQQRRNWWAGMYKTDSEPNLVERTFICTAEIWHELFLENKQITPQDSRMINGILGKILSDRKEWTRLKGNKNISDYGRQRGYVRIMDTK